LSLIFVFTGAAIVPILPLDAILRRMFHATKATLAPRNPEIVLKR